MSRIGGRPRQFDEADIVRVGREIGMRDLSMNAVASRLGVSSAALYRHIEDRWALERLVGEGILGELELADDPADGTVAHLLALGVRLRAFLLEHPGLAAYVQILFPRGEGGRRLLAMGAAGLTRRGYEMDAAIVLCSAVASVVIGYAATEEAQRERADGLEAERRNAIAELLADARLGVAHRVMPEVSADEYVRLWLGSVVRGFVSAAPPGRSLVEIMAALRAAGEDF
ncbi:MAG: TetR family transcriptional regulator [Microbacterium sp.]|jgi:AcrR family transcriptional regulator|nr:TetR family transcriptional regulator [Microbacterium sp.]